MSSDKIHVFNPKYVADTMKVNKKAFRITPKVADANAKTTPKAYGSATFHPVDFLDKDGKFKPLMMAFTDVTNPESKFFVSSSLSDPKDPKNSAMKDWAKTIAFTQRSAPDYFEAISLIEEEMKVQIREHIASGKIFLEDKENYKIVDLIKKTNSKKQFVPEEIRGKAKENPEGRIKLDLKNKFSMTHPRAPLRGKDKTTLTDFATKQRLMCDGAPANEQNLHKVLTRNSRIHGGFVDLSSISTNSDKNEISLPQNCVMAVLEPGKEASFDENDFMPTELQDSSPSSAAQQPQTTQAPQTESNGNSAKIPGLDSTGIDPTIAGPLNDLMSSIINK